MAAQGWAGCGDTDSLRRLLVGVASALAPGLVCVRGGVCGGARADMLELLLEVLMNVAIIREYLRAVAS